MRSDLRAVLCLGLISWSVTGCSPSVLPDDQATSWVPPAWFAEQTRELEELQTSLQSCMDGRGWSLTIDATGGIEEPIPEDQRVPVGVDMAACYTAFGLDVTTPSALTRADYGDWYQGNVDTRECLVARGYAMAEPPSVDAWVEAMLEASSSSGSADSRTSSAAAPWDPYSDPALSLLTEEEWAAIQTSCPAWHTLPPRLGS